MKLLSLYFTAVFAAKNEECPANSEGAAERCESACQDSYIGRILIKYGFKQYKSYGMTHTQTTRLAIPRNSL